MKKNNTIQIRVSSEDKEMIKKISLNDSNFNLSSFVREKIKEYYKGIFKGIGSLMIG